VEITGLYAPGRYRDQLWLA